MTTQTTEQDICAPACRAIRESLMRIESHDGLAPQWTRQFHHHVKTAADFLEYAPDRDARRKAAINLRVAVNLTDHRDLHHEYAAQREAAARSFNELIQTDTGISFLPILDTATTPNLAEAA